MQIKPSLERLQRASDVLAALVSQDPIYAPILDRIAAELSLAQQAARSQMVVLRRKVST